MEITKNNTIGEVIKLNDGMEEVFLGFGMHCLHCPMSQIETLEEAAAVHNIDLDLLLKKLNEALNFSVKGSIKSSKKVKKANI